ncbi:MAG: hypothetical protein WBM32_07055, partial [Crocosphaera sp.]
RQFWKVKKRVNLTLSVKHHSLLIMAQQLIQTIEAQGRTYAEYRDEPDQSDLLLAREKKLFLQVEKSFPNDLYEYPEPNFCLGSKVVIAEEWDYCKENGIDFLEESEIYKISAIELIEPTFKSGRGLSEPAYCMFGILGTKGTYELVWFRDDELLSIEQLSIHDNLDAF